MARLGNLVQKTGWTVADLQNMGPETLERLIEFQTQLDKIETEEWKRKLAEAERR